MKDETSGKIRIENDTIFWDYRDKNVLQIALDEIFIIGEYTTSEGAGFDDWFFVFVDKTGGWKKISCYADNLQSLLNFLAEKIHPDLKNVSMANSANWKTVVRYPDSLKGKSLFKLVQPENPKSFLTKMKYYFLKTKFIELDDEAHKIITNASR